MTIDLSKGKPGDTLKLRCGGEIVVPEDWREMTGSWYSAAGLLPWRKNGTTLQKPVFDIIEIISKPFDWKDVKPGMAFIEENGHIWLFFAPGWVTKDSFKTFQQSKEGGYFNNPDDFGTHPRWFIFKYLTRCPEHDITEKDND
jgi:hypothetical protein